MNFFLEKNLKLRELEDINHKINELSADENRTPNTDSRSRLLEEQERITQELMIICIAEKATFTQSNPRRMISVPDQQAENVHQAEENVD